MLPSSGAYPQSGNRAGTGRASNRAEAGQKASLAARGDAKSSRDESLVTQKEFEDKVAFSTIDLSLYQLSKIRQSELTDVEAVFAKNSPGFFSRLGNSLSVGWYGVLDVCIELIKLFRCGCCSHWACGPTALRRKSRPCIPGETPREEGFRTA